MRCEVGRPPVKEPPCPANRVVLVETLCLVETRGPSGALRPAGTPCPSGSLRPVETRCPSGIPPRNPLSLRNPPGPLRPVETRGPAGALRPRNPLSRRNLH
ncbi:Protein of unknown function [Propionibacterium freudenreichii]|nr:Protein of unknown function [Propionibacterium freudenreichii]CEG96761.1 Protein of unknown function [Propionibacterium freudenreichii]CEG97929.1 Protein of unknown function [Propionibacterium freudenreichii]CEI28524.1 Protein of unknown function [Propionibacterium freudenreichii]